MEEFKKRPELEDFYDVDDPRGCSSSEHRAYEEALAKWKDDNKITTEVMEIPEKGIVEMNGHRYWYEFIVAQKGDMCLATRNPMRYCNGIYAYSPKDPGNGKAFVIMETDDPSVYSTDPVVVEEERKVDSVVMHDTLDKPAGSFGVSKDPSLIEKWKPMLEAQGITDPSKQAWMATYCENHVKFDKEQIAKGNKVIGDDVRALVGEEAAQKMDESLSFTEPDSTPILESEEDAKVFVEAIENPKPPNKKLKEAAKKYKGERHFEEPTKKPGLFKRILNWFTS